MRPTTLVLAGIALILGVVALAFRAAQPEGRAEVLDVAWPPTIGERYPDLQLLDLDGKPFSLASLEGKVLLVEFAATECEGSIKWAGMDSFGVIPAQHDTQSFDDAFRILGIDRDDPDLLTVHLVLLKDPYHAPPIEEVRAFAYAADLDMRKNAVVLTGPGLAYVQPEIEAFVPGVHLLDHRFVLRASSGRSGGSDLFNDLLPRTGELLAEMRAERRQKQFEESGETFVDRARRRRGSATPPPPPTGVRSVAAELPPTDFAHHPPSSPAGDSALRLYEPLMLGDWARADRVFAALREERPEDGRFEDRAWSALQCLVHFPPARSALRDWVQARPYSAPAQLAYASMLYGDVVAAREQSRKPDGSVTDLPAITRQFSLADKHLANAEVADPGLPHTVPLRFAIKQAQGRSLAEIQYLYKQSIADSPGFVPVRFAMQEILQQHEPASRSVKLQRDLVRDTLTEVANEPALLLMVPRLHRDIASETGQGAEYLAVDEVASAIDHAMKTVLATYPRQADAWIEQLELARMRGDDAGILRALERAAELGNARACAELAVRVRKRGGSDASALDWSQRAARLGARDVYGRVGWTYAELDGDGAFDPIAALAWFQLGSEVWDRRSVFGLGVAYERGWNGRTHPERARALFERAASLGLPEAREKLNR